LNRHPTLVHQHVVFEGGNYFRDPTLLEFISENPVRHGTLPANIVEVAKVILDAGPSQSAKNETLMLVSAGSVPRECRAQLPLIDILCDYGADPNSAIQSAALHGELDIENVRRLLAGASSEDRHLPLTLAADFGQAGVARLLLDAGKDPNRPGKGTMT
jgi:hypothetical protein